MLMLFSEQILQHVTAGGVSKPARSGRETSEMHPELYPKICHRGKGGSTNHLTMSRWNGEVC